MLAHYEAIAAALTADSSMRATQVHVIDVVEKPSFPYVVLWGPPVGLPGQRALGVTGDIRERVYATCTGDTAASALVVARNVTRILGGEKPNRLPVPGRSAWLRLVEARPVEKDPGLIIPGTNESPKFTVLIFELSSTPA